jgi:NitT/TauT family transport system substrate-binding protein
MQTLFEFPFDNWREYDAEDRFRFYSLRLHDDGIIKKSPQIIIADVTYFLFFNDLKRELKA